MLQKLGAFNRETVTMSDSVSMMTGSVYVIRLFIFYDWSGRLVTSLKVGATLVTVN